MALIFIKNMTSTRLFAIVSFFYWLLGMHFFMHNPGGQGLYLPFNAWGWVYASLVIGLGLWTVTVKQQIIFTTLQKNLWVGASLLLLPMFYPGFELKNQALPRLLGLLAGLLFLFCLYQWRLSRQARERMLHLLLGAVAVEALLGLVQFYLFNPGNSMGYNTVANRPYGIFQQPNVMATFMATGLALAIWLEIHTNTGNWLKTLRCGVMVSTCMLLAILQSRVGILGGLLVLMLLAPELLRRRMWVVVGMVALGVAMGLVIQPESQQVTQRGLEIYLSGGIRTLYWSHAADLIAKSPWSGWGYGSFEFTFLNEYANKVAINPGTPPIGENIDHPHNEFLFWALEGGLAAMLGLLLMTGTLLWRMSRAGWVKGLGWLALLTPILLHTQTEYPLYHAVALWWLLLILIYTMDADIEEVPSAKAHPNLNETAYQPKLLLRAVAALIPLVMVPYMLTGLHTAWVVTQFERNGYSKSELLDSIVNPLPWLSRIENIVYTLRLQEGLITRDAEQLQAFVDWAEGHVRHTPRSRLYSNMTVALQTMGRLEEARIMQARGLRLYPNSPGLLKALDLGSTLRNAGVNTSK